MVWGHSIQFVFALIALRWELGNQIVQCLSSKVSTVQYSTDRPVSQQHGQNSAVQCRTVQYMVRTVQQLKL